MRGSASVGFGAVGDAHDRLFMYAHANPLSQLPTWAFRSVPISSDGSGVSRPTLLAAIWSTEVPLT